MDGFFQHGLYPDWGFISTCCGKTLREKQVYLGGLILWAVGDILNFIWGGTSFLFVIFSCIAFFGTAFVNSLNWALVPDTVDYGEWKTGIRAEGSVYTGYTFSRKISAALAGFAGIMLTQIGYIPNIAQSDTTLLGLRQLIFMALRSCHYRSTNDGLFISSMNNVSLLLSRKLPNERKQVIKLSRLIINKVFLL